MITLCDALTGFPLIRMCPARQAAVAAERVLYARIAHSQASTRTLAGDEDGILMIGTSLTGAERAGENAGNHRVHREAIENAGEFRR